jgi:hypothetical protein
MADNHCQWVREADGTTTLVPGCWSRVIDADADCACGEWSEATARETIKGLRSSLFRIQHINQQLRAALKGAGIADPTFTPNTRSMAARRRRHEMHKAIRTNGSNAGI